MRSHGQPAASHHVAAGRGRAPGAAQRQELALDALAKAEAEGMLYDADWLERCPLFAPLRREPAFEEIQHRVRQRADRIWRAAPERRVAAGLR